MPNFFSDVDLSCFFFCSFFLVFFFFFGGGGGGACFYSGCGMLVNLTLTHCHTFLECGWYLWAKGRQHKFSRNLLSVTQFNMMPSFSIFSFPQAPQSQNQHMVLQ